jgi:hypothetical protein|tara:strand:- start:1544 stop:2065 length:522 start_codon:yes stop_codon:yes gene_type:complete
MIYGTPVKGEDGLYHVRAYTDDRKRYFVRVDGSKIVDINDDDITFDVNASEAIDSLHDMNIASAIENSEAWFGKKVSDKTIRSSYIRDETITADRIEQTKFFGDDRVPLENDALQSDMTCSVILEFGGLWFAKKAFGPAWNVVQVKACCQKSCDAQENFDETYPEDYMFEDDE